MSDALSICHPILHLNRWFSVCASNQTANKDLDYHGCQWPQLQAPDKKDISEVLFATVLNTFPLTLRQRAWYITRERMPI